eukprot:03527_6
MTALSLVQSTCSTKLEPLQVPRRFHSPDVSTSMKLSREATASNFPFGENFISIVSFRCFFVVISFNVCELRTTKDPSKAPTAIIFPSAEATEYSFLFICFWLTRARSLASQIINIPSSDAVAYLSDFGVARPHTSPSPWLIKHFGVVLPGSNRYISPPIVPQIMRPPNSVRALIHVLLS